MLINPKRDIISHVYTRDCDTVYTDPKNVAIRFKYPFNRALRLHLYPEQNFYKTAVHGIFLKQIEEIIPIEAITRIISDYFNLI